VSLANDLLQHFEPEIESLALLPSDGGRFEIVVNEKLVYSKLQTGRHIDAGEAVALVEKVLHP
jgi:selenoprotein W-related protein